jgi:ribosomal protein L33
MARGKSQFCTWFCAECNAPNYITAYNKKHEVVKELQKFCKTERKRITHKRKDTKKGS